MAQLKVIGGSGFIGRHVVAALLDAGHQVEAPSQAEFDIAAGDPIAMAARLSGAEIVVNCAGLARESRQESLAGVNAEGARRLALACRVGGVKRLVHVSALGAGANDTTRFQRSKGEGEEAIRRTEGLQTVIVRPSMVLGAGGASGDFFSALAALPLPPRFDRGEWKIQPLHVSELAELIVRLAVEADPPALVEAVGPAPITTDELTRELREWLQLPAMTPLGLPRALLNFFAWANEIVEMGPGDRELLNLLERGSVGDPASITAALGRKPLSFAESLARQPSTIADLWRARLYFLQPLFRLSLAALWLGTGLVSFGLFPPDEFYVMLGELGLTGPLAEVALFGAAGLNMALGFLMLVNWRPTRIAQAMFALLVVFSGAALMLPHEYWLTPFAPILKNAPIAAALLAFMGMQKPSPRTARQPFARLAATVRPSPAVGAT
jgi:uncharacterized protein YbjT (DUF2867 family)